MVGCVPVYEWMRMVAREAVLHSIPFHRVLTSAVKSHQG